MHSSHETADPRLVAALTGDAPDAIARLERFGVAFTHDADGRYRLARCGGATRKRLLQVGDRTGHAIATALRGAVGGTAASRRSTTRRCRRSRPAGELARDAGAARRRRPGVTAGAIVLAAGGRCFAEAKRLGTFSTNAVGATGEVTDIALAAGCEACDLDALQYHPNGGLWPVTMQGYSIPETTRAYGALLLNANGERFVDELGGRDVVAAAIVRECEEGRGLTTPEGRPSVLLTAGRSRPPMRDLAALHAQALSRGRHRSARRADPHLFGAALPERRSRDRRGRGDDRRGLYAAGEISGGVHGRNRMMGNSLLDGSVFGWRAGPRGGGRGRLSGS